MRVAPHSGEMMGKKRGEKVLEIAGKRILDDEIGLWNSWMGVVFKMWWWEVCTMTGRYDNFLIKFRVEKSLLNEKL